jgi:hypothetical protein
LHLEVESESLNLNYTARKLKRHAQSRPECDADCLSRQVSLPRNSQAQCHHGDKGARLLQTIRMQSAA